MGVPGGARVEPAQHAEMVFFGIVSGERDPPGGGEEKLVGRGRAAFDKLRPIKPTVDLNHWQLGSGGGAGGGQP